MGAEKREDCVRCYRWHDSKFSGGSVDWYITYGQAVYSTLANAVDSVTAEEPVIDQELRDACLRAYLILKGNTTDLSDTTNNKISKAGKISPPL